MKAKRIAVVGAGLVGVTTAYALAKQGHQVTLLERENSVAMHASFGTSGLMSALTTRPLTAKGRRAALLCSLLQSRAALRLALPLHGSQWLSAWLRSAAADVHEPWLDHLQQLRRENHEVLSRWRDELDLQYQRSHGLWCLFRTPEEAQQATIWNEQVSRWASPALWLDKQQVFDKEPLLNKQTLLSGALWSETDEAGNPRQFAQELLHHAKQLDVQVQFGQTLLGITPGAQVRLLLQQASQPGQFTQAEQIFDACVLCVGSKVAHFGVPLKRQHTAMPLFTYTLTVPLRNEDYGPRAAMFDARYEVSIVRLGKRLRLSGATQFGGTLTSRADLMPRAAKQTLQTVLDDWFAGQTVAEQAQFWMGEQHGLAASPPLIGPCELPGVWLNLGYGAHTWALACAGAERLALQLQES